MATIISIVALSVMIVAATGMFWQFLQINKENEKLRDKFDQMLDKCDQLLAKFDQLVTLLVAINTPVVPPPLTPKRKVAKKRRVAVPTVDVTGVVPNPATTEPKGGTDGDEKTNPVG